MEPWWNFGGILVLWWNPRGTLPQTTPDHPCSYCRTWWNLGGTLVQPWWNPRGTLVEPSWNPRGTLPQTTPDHPAALVEPSWNRTSGPPRTTPEPIWAETPKLSAVGEKGRKKKVAPHVQPETTLASPKSNLAHGRRCHFLRLLLRQKRLYPKPPTSFFLNWRS